MSSLGQHIATARKTAGLRQSDLAERIGRSTYYVALIEQGRRRPSKAVAVAIGEVLGVDLDTMGLRPYRLMWAEADTAQICDLWNNGHTSAEIAAVMGQSTRSIERRISRLHLAGRLDYRYPDRCTEPGCRAPHYAKARCQNHYRKAAAINGVVWRRFVAPEPSQTPSEAL